MQSALLPTGAFLVSLLVNLYVIRRAERSGWFIDAHDADKPQRFHEHPTPRAGGVGIFAGLLPLLILPGGWKILLPAFLAFLSGIMEDFHQSLSPRQRLALQLLAALVAVFSAGAVVDYLGFGLHLPAWIAILFSAFAMVGAMNAFNIIDGFNGLASGMGILILLSFSAVALQHDDYTLLTLFGVTFASLSGFFLLNFPKGRLFLGDGGAYLLGFLLALAGILLASRYDSVSPWYVLAVLIYPVWEVLFSILRKLSEGRSPMEPDRYHLHMLIYRRITRSNPGTSLFILGANLPFLLAATLFHHNSKVNFGLVLLFVMLYVYFYRRLRAKDRKDSQRASPNES